MGISPDGKRLINKACMYGALFGAVAIGTFMYGQSKITQENKDAQLRYDATEHMRNSPEYYQQQQKEDAAIQKEYERLQKQGQ